MQNKRLGQILELLDKNQTDTFLLYAAALEYQSLNNFEMAFQYFKRVFDTNPNYLGLYYPMAKLCMQLNLMEEALVKILEGIELSKIQKNHKTQMELEGLLDEIHE